MDVDPLRAIATQHGVFQRHEALAFGYDDRQLGRLRRARLIVRVRHGAYTFTDLWDAADLYERHRIHARAVIRSYGARVALSHTTAAVMHGIELWDADLSRVHVTRLDGGAGRTEADVVHHEGVCLRDDVVPAGDLLLTAPARAAVETASLLPVEAGVVVADSVLHRGLATPAEVTEQFELLSHWPGTQHLHVVSRLADGRAASAGESRCRYLFFAEGLPMPELQFEVRDPTGDLVGITDFAWPRHRLLGEFDGRVKYGRLLRPGETPGDAVFREKVREDRLREVTGCRIVRLVWADLHQRAQTARRLRRFLHRAA